MNNGMTLSQAVLVLLVAIAGFIGWVLNIITLATAELTTGMLVLRAAGIIVAPLGAVLGYIPS